MKKVIINFSLCLIMGIFTAYAQCDTLKWKAFETYYAKVHLGTYYKMNDGVILNMDTISDICPAVNFTNISTDTFYKNTNIVFFSGTKVYADTGLIVQFSGVVPYIYPFDILPGDTLNSAIEMKANLNSIVSAVEAKGLTIEDIAYCYLFVGVAATQKDGSYTERVFYAGADSTLFYITKTPPPSIQETAQTEISVFPNPAQSHFTVTHTENANLTLYNILGQKVKQVVGEGETTVIYTEDLPQGIYLLKVEKEGAVLTKKIQISK